MLEHMELSSAEKAIDLHASMAKISQARRQSRWMLILAWLLEKPWRNALTLGFLDVLGATAGLILGLVLTISFDVQEDLGNYVYPFSCYNLYLLVLFYLKKGYGPLNSRRSEEELQIIVTGNTVAILLVLTTNFLVLKEVVFSRYIFAIGYVLAMFFTFTFRFSLRELQKVLWHHGLATEKVLIVGDAVRHIKWLLNHLHIQQYRGLHLLGYLADKPSPTFVKGLTYLGQFQDLEEMHRREGVDKVFFAMLGYSNQRHDTLVARLEECARLKITALVISKIFNNFNYSLTLDGYSGIFAIDRREPAYSKPFYRLLKRTMDIMGSLMIILVTFPLWLVVILGIKLGDYGPIFYRSRRVGKGGGQFGALKFRTMVVNADEILNNDPKMMEEYRKGIKLDPDPRITPIGRWLRKWSLDEIPQFINVLKGEMSLVGPRPALLEEVDLIGDFIHKRNLTRPGLTGFWQVSGRSNTSYEERVEMDIFYLNKCCIWMDLMILLKTPFKVISRDGAQ